MTEDDDQMEEEEDEESSFESTSVAWGGCACRGCERSGVRFLSSHEVICEDCGKIISDPMGSKDKLQKAAWTKDGLVRGPKASREITTNINPKGESMTKEQQPELSPSLDATLSEALHTEPANDHEAAKRGAKRFRTKFADAEVHSVLDRVAVPGAIWCVTVHSMVPGDVGDNGHAVIRHWLKHSDRLPHEDLAKCAAAVAELVARTIPLESLGDLRASVGGKILDVFAERKRRAEVGIVGQVDAAPSTFGDEED